jgi:prophage regulatory protein
MNGPIFEPLEPMLTLKQVNELTSLSHSQVYRMIGDGRFPAPVRISPSRIAFIASDIKRWIGERLTAPKFTAG